MSNPQFIMQRLQSRNDIVQYEYTRLSATDRESAIKEAMLMLETNETFKLFTKVEERGNNIFQ